MSYIQSEYVGTREHATAGGTPPRALTDARLIRAAEIISGKWNLRILAGIAERPRRFSELLAGLTGISPNILTAKLRELEAASVVQRKHLPLPANCWVYQLADKGDRLRNVIAVLTDWVDTVPDTAGTMRNTG